ncbi:hypothetical protein PIB30_030131 [Stylosanthes scabra]|uniref:SLC26A/SulP transporter domain-containing protein n=1 Tax=Stylosanthes scabra TaxID=79078 RepID=A0ABU6Z8F2_9FABA|nr:hypothetical protein [Stylosanthes scabra]
MRLSRRSNPIPLLMRSKVIISVPPPRFRTLCSIIVARVVLFEIIYVGDIPQCLPKFSVPKAFEYVESLIPIAALLTGVAILESVGIAKALAAKNGIERSKGRADLLVALVFLKRDDEKWMKHTLE